MTTALAISDREALGLRDQLLTEGYTVVPQVFEQPNLALFSQWTARYFERHGNDPRFRYQGSDIKVYSPAYWAMGTVRRNILDLKDPHTHLNRRIPDALATRFVSEPRLRHACAAIGLESITSDQGMVTILSKPAHGPPLYWHQAFMDWDHPSAVTPWPTRVFLGTYLTDTSKENGCLRVIPGTHRQRIDLHDLLLDAHEESVREATLESVAFAERNDAVNLPMQAGDLVVCDARTLHAAHANKSGKRRTMLLAWHDVFPFPSPPVGGPAQFPTLSVKPDPSCSPNVSNNAVQVPTWNNTVSPHLG